MPSAVLSIPAYLVTHGRLAGVACGRLEVVPFLLAFITAIALSLVHVGVAAVDVVSTPLFAMGDGAQGI